MILCVTPNPALDRTSVVEHFTPGKVFRAQSSMGAAGGKGVNVARAIGMLGGDATCAGFVGGNTGRFIAELAEHEGLKSSWTWIDGETRTCIIIADPNTGEATVVNEKGPTVTHDDWTRLNTHVTYAASEADCICFSGSLPPASPVEAFTALVAKLRAQGKRLWVDTSGEALAASRAIKGIGIKINGDEIGEILGKAVDDAASAANAANTLRASGTETVLVTLGAKGAVMAHASGTWYAYPPLIKVMSAVGSGDSFLAGLVQALETGKNPSEALQWAVAAGAANALTVGGGQFAFSDFKRILSETTIENLS